MPIDYQKIYRKFRLICNNTLGGGSDCYGSSFCAGDCKHEETRCGSCVLVICGHCLELLWEDKCPACGDSLKVDKRAPSSPDEWFRHNVVCFGKKLDRQSYSQRRCDCDFD